MKKFTRKATRVGKRSMAVVIPSDIVKELKIRERQKLNVSLRGKKIIIVYTAKARCSVSMRK